MQDLSRERRAYENMKQDLLRKHPSKFVAIYQEQVIAVDEDKGHLIARVREKFGVSAFIKKIEDDEPQYRLPTLRRLTGD